MAHFLEELWNSVFTPGPTPTLLIATNAAFAALQALLLGLLVATYSVHFIILSFLCAGLWLSINWFSKEVQAFQASEEHRNKGTSQGDSQSGIQSRAGYRDESDDDDDTSGDNREIAANASASGTDFNTTIRGSGAEPNTARQSTRSREGDTTYLAPGDLPRQRQSLGESIGDLSTDSEWEKVDDE